MSEPYCSWRKRYSGSCNLCDKTRRRRKVFQKVKILQRCLRFEPKRQARYGHYGHCSVIADQRSTIHVTSFERGENRLLSLISYCTISWMNVVHIGRARIASNVGSKSQIAVRCATFQYTAKRCISSSPARNQLAGFTDNEINGARNYCLELVRYVL